MNTPEQHQMQDFADRELERMQEEYQQIHNYDILPVPIAQAHQSPLQEENLHSDQDNPYQMMEDCNDDNNSLFSDKENEDQQQQIPKEERHPWEQQWTDSCQEEPEVEIQLATPKYYPQEAKIDSQKIKEIATNMQLSCPSWMNDSKTFEARIKQLFSKGVTE